jgi:Patatin-like phospholipase
MLGSQVSLGRMPTTDQLIHPQRMQMFSRVARRSKALQVACASGKTPNNKNKLLDSEAHERAISTLRNSQEIDRRSFSERLRGSLYNSDIHERAISTLRNSQEIDWRTFTEQLGGTLVVSDEEHRAVVQQAAKENNLSFGFSAGGMLFPYYCGVASALADGGLINDETKLGGASAGSLIAACIKSGMAFDEIINHCLRLMHDCRTNGTRGRLGPVLETFLKEYLPEDAHERCKDKAYVAVTKALPYVRPVLVSDFYSRDDLIQALMTSCHIPWYLDGASVTEFRGAAHLDGGLTNFIPVVPGTVGIRVCCFPSKQLSPLYRIGISPDSYDEEWDYSLRQMVQWAFEPADEKFVQYFIEKGKTDTQEWMNHMGLREESKIVEEKVEEQTGHVAAAKKAAAAAGAGAGVAEDKENVNVNKEKQDEQVERGAEELEQRSDEQVAAGKA